MLDHDDLAALMDSWFVHLAAQRKSPQTITAYRKGVRQFLAWCHTEDVKPALDPATVAAFVAALLDDGKAPTTARLRQLAVRRFSAWLADEDEIDRDLLIGVKPPKVDTKVVDDLDEDQLRALIKACAGKSLSCKRDEAIVRLMSETGARAGEVVNMHTGDIDVIRGLAVIRRGKGGAGRHIPFGPATGAAIDRYLRARRKHRHAAGPRLWLGEQSRGFSYDALYKSLKARARVAGIDDFHPHQLRHTWASRWLAAGGSEQGAMAVGGWARRDMLDRYTKATTEKRAADESRRLGLGDL
jgi:integrase/recombinase XerD